MSEIILNIKQGNGKGVKGKEEVETTSFHFPNILNSAKEDEENETGSTENG